MEVWWTDSRRSLCWPQELYRIGDYDSEAGELWDDETVFDEVEEGGVEEGVNDFDFGRIAAYETFDDSQESWETESEVSVEGDISIRYFS